MFANNPSKSKPPEVKLALSHSLLWPTSPLSTDPHPNMHALCPIDNKFRESLSEVSSIHDTWNTGRHKAKSLWQLIAHIWSLKWPDEYDSRWRSASCPGGAVNVPRCRPKNSAFPLLSYIYVLGASITAIRNAEKYASARNRQSPPASPNPSNMNWQVSCLPTNRQNGPRMWQHQTGALSPRRLLESHVLQYPKFKRMKHPRLALNHRCAVALLENDINKEKKKKKASKV